MLEKRPAFYTTPIVDKILPAANNIGHKIKNDTYSGGSLTETSKKRRNAYKPRPTKYLSLLSFAFILVSCIVMIEIIIRKSTRPEDMISLAPHPLSSFSPSSIISRRDVKFSTISNLTSSLYNKTDARSTSSILLNITATTTSDYLYTPTNNLLLSTPSYTPLYSTAGQPVSSTVATIYVSKSSIPKDSVTDSVTLMRDTASGQPFSDIESSAESTAHAMNTTSTEQQVTVSVSGGPGLPTNPLVLTSVVTRQPSTQVFSEEATSSPPLQTPTEMTSAKTATLYTLTTEFSSFVITTDANGQTTSVTAVVIEETPVTTSPSLWTSLSHSGGFASATTTQHLAPIQTLATSEAVIRTKSMIFDYFAGSYIATLIAVSIKILWEIIFSAFKLMEPFEYLSGPKVVSAKQALFTQYLSNSMSWDFLRAFFSGRIVPVLTSIIYLLVTVLAAIVSSSMTVRATAYCPSDTPGKFARCAPAWIINISILRAVEGLLGGCVVLLFAIMGLTRTYTPSMPWNPSSIISVAALFNYQPLIGDFREINPKIDTAGLERLLRGRTCRLEDYEDSQNKRYFGITRKLTGETVACPSRLSFINRLPDEDDAICNAESPQYEFGPRTGIPERIQACVLDITQLATSAGLFAVVLTYGFGHIKSQFREFFDSGVFWARFILVAIATVVDMQWKRLEREIRILEPYRHMGKGFASPRTTVLMPLDGTCWSQLPQTLTNLLRHKHMWFQTLVSLIAILSDFNIIATAGIVWSDGQTAQAFYASFHISLGVTGLMTGFMLLTMLWWRNTHVVSKMPIFPDHVGGVMAYLCVSDFTEFVSSEQYESMTQKERDDKFMDLGRSMCFREQAGVDGQIRWTIDFDDIH